MSNVVPKDPYGGTLPSLYADRIPLGNVVSPIWAAWRAAQQTKQDRFWSTPQRDIGDGTREVLDVTFTGARLINFIQFQTAHFPHVVMAEYREEETGAWRPFIEVASAYISAVARSADFWDSGSAFSNGAPCAFLVADSLPPRVNPASLTGFEHPQHFGAGHWTPVGWKVQPVQTTRVRLVLVRNPYGIPPNDQAGNPARYSLGVKDFQVGYRIVTKDDVPRYGDIDTHSEDFASSTDLLGSRVVYSLKADRPANVTDGLDTTIWRCDPQPVNYAVVNFYADTRDSSGLGQVIDRWFMDPTTVGPYVNLYYSNDSPTVDFQASDEPLAYPVVQRFGSSTTPQQQPNTTDVTSVVYSELLSGFTDINNSFIQFDPSKVWWLGLGMISTTHLDGHHKDDPSGPTDHPWMSFGQNTLRQNGSNIEFINEFGQVATLPLPSNFGTGAHFVAGVIYNPVASQDFPKGYTLFFRMGDAAMKTVTWDLLAIKARPSTISIGRYPTFGSPGHSGINVRSMILKVKAPRAAELALFSDDPQGFVRQGDLPTQDDLTTDNSILRLHPLYSVPQTNPEGLVGGPGDQYAGMVWTPIAQDFTMKKGFMYVPPTRAKFWKFEMTNLLPESFESFVPILRQVKVFNSQTVAAFAQISAGQQGWGVPKPAGTGGGVRTQMSLNDMAVYSDAVDMLAASAQADTGQPGPTTALYVPDASQAASIAQTGWVWGFSPWHAGTTAPRFVNTQVHQYETVNVRHVTKVAFFAGLKTLTAYRLDYLAECDVDQYTEHFHDMVHIESQNGMVVSDNQFTSAGYYSTAQSKTLNSHRPVRAIQFASVQTDSQAILPDDGFLDDDLSVHWSVYGDSQLVLDLVNRAVLVNRGWYARTYGQMQVSPGYETYGALEGRLYGEVEGGQPNGLAGGGLVSQKVTPSNSGRIYVAAKVSSDMNLSGPVEVQLLSVQGDVVLASTEVDLRAGETAKVWVGYKPGSIPNPLLYSGIQGRTYGSLEAGTYGTYESTPIVGDVYARVIQPGGSNDRFTIKRLSIFDDPISWDFSIDGGTTWFDAMDVRNDPNGVLSLPVSGNALRWRVRMYRPGAGVSALAIRPWYGGLLGSLPSNHGLQVIGPNRSVMDQFPTIETDPMWQQWDQPIPRSWFDEAAVTAVQPVPVTPPQPITPPLPQQPNIPSVALTGTDTLFTSDSVAAFVTPGIGTVIDNFDRPDYQPLGTASNGTGWAQVSGPGTIELHGGKAVAEGGATRNRIDIGGPDQHFRGDLQVAHLGAFAFRVSDENDRYEVQFSETQTSLYAIVAGVSTLIGQDTNSGHGGIVHNYRVQIAGSTINVYRDALPIPGLTGIVNSSITTGTAIEFYLGTPGDNLDNLTQPGA